MSKMTLTVGFVTLVVAASLGYQSFSDNSTVTVSNAVSNAESGNEQNLASQKQASPAVVEFAASPSSRTAITLPSSDVISDAITTEISADQHLADSIPTRESDRDMQRMPRQALEPMRAPGAGPRAGEDYAHHPRPGSEQSITAPVSRSAPEPTPTN